MSKIDIKNTKGVKIYFVDLPEPTPFVHINAVFKSGFYSEDNKDYGLAHLVEHYLASNIHNKISKESRVNGHTYDDFMTMTLRSNIDANNNDIEEFVETCFSPTFDKKEILEYEKLGLESEIITKYHDESLNIINTVFRHRLNEGNKYSRDRVPQVDNTNTANLPDVQGRYSDLLESQPFVIVMAHSLSRESVDHITGKIEEGLVSHKCESREVDLFSGASTKYSADKYEEVASAAVAPGYSKVYITFPGIGLNDPEIENIKTKMLVSLLAANVTNLLKKKGIYNAKSVWATRKDYGLIGLYSDLRSEKVNVFVDIVEQQINSFKLGQIDKEEFEALKAEKLRQDQSNVSKNSIQQKSILFDLVYFGELKYSLSWADIISSITVSDIQEVANKYLDTRAGNTLVFSSK